MLNAEKYKNEILEIIDGFENYGVTERNQIIMCEENGCCICQFCKDHFCDYKAKTRWLLSEYKEPPVKLTRLEYLLLKLFDKKDYKYITRGIGGYLYAHKGKCPPKKNGGIWYNCETYIDFEMIDDLFQFVKWEDEEPTSVKKLLNNCEVIDNE